MDGQFVEVFVLEHSGREFQFPVARSRQTFEGILGLFAPSVEVAHEIDFSSVGRPFAKHPLASRTVKAEVEVSVGKVGKFSRTLAELGQFVERMVVTAFYGSLVRLEPRIVFDELQLFFRGATVFLAVFAEARVAVAFLPLATAVVFEAAFAADSDVFDFMELRV